MDSGHFMSNVFVCTDSGGRENSFQQIGTFSSRLEIDGNIVSEWSSLPATSGENLSYLKYLQKTFYYKRHFSNSGKGNLETMSFSKWSCHKHLSLHLWLCLCAGAMLWEREYRQFEEIRAVNTIVFLALFD